MMIQNMIARLIETAARLAQEIRSYQSLHSMTAPAKAVNPAAPRAASHTFETSTAFGGAALCGVRAELAALATERMAAVAV